MNNNNKCLKIISKLKAKIQILLNKYFQYLKFIILIMCYLNKSLVLKNKRTNISIYEIKNLEYSKFLSIFSFFQMISKIFEEEMNRNDLN